MNRPRMRIPPLPREKWTDEARDVFAFWGQPGAWENGSKLAKDMVMAQHPALATAFNIFSKHLLLENSVPPRPRELAILRCAWRLNDEYVWHFHVGYGLTAGLSLEQIAAIPAGPDDGFWQDKPDDAAIMRAVDELMTQNGISEATWTHLATFLDTHQLMDFTFTIPAYVMLNWANNSFGISLDEDLDVVGFDLKTRSGNPPPGRFRPTETENWEETGA